MSAATLVAVIFRLVYVFAYPQVEPLCPDCGMYDRVAVNLVAGNGLVYDGPEATELGVAGPVITFGPVYPAFLAVFYWIAGHDATAVRAAQALLGGLLVPMMWRLGQLAFGDRAASIGAWLVALSIPLAVYSGMLLTEALSTLLLVCAIWLFAEATARRSTAWFVTSGAISGLLILLREEMLAVAAVVLFVALWKARPVHLAAYALTVVVCVGVWTTRNYVVFHAPILVTAKAGEQLWITAKGWSEWQFNDPGYRSMVEGHNVIERDTILRNDALRMIAAQPLRYLTMSVRRVPELWVSSHTSYIYGLTESFGAYRARGATGRVGVKLVLLGVQIVLLALAVWGAAHLVRTAQMSYPAWLAAAPIVVVTVIHFFLFATPRYQIPALPFVLAFAGVAISRVVGPPP